MKFGSLFAGIGGMDLGLERAGMECAWQVEIDDYARRVLEKHWPNVRRHDDVRTFPPTDCAEWHCDLIAGGFPCQDISNAGNRAGISGERSGLWTEFARIVRLLRPRFVLVENVSALLNRGLDTVLGDLAASGYDAEWDCIPAAALGAPHIRDRVYLIAYPRLDGLEAFGKLETARRFAQPPNRNNPGVDSMRLLRELPLHDSRKTRIRMRLCADRGFTIQSLFAGPAWSAESPLCRVASRVPYRVDRLRALGNAVVQQVAEWIGRRIMKSAGGPT